jgi:hypothetical protein
MAETSCVSSKMTDEMKKFKSEQKNETETVEYKKDRRKKNKRAFFKCTEYDDARMTTSSR